MQSVIETNYSAQPVPTGKTNGAPKAFRWTVNHYYKMGDLGFFYGKRVQLIRGEIIEMAPMGTPHATSIGLVSRILDTVFDKRFHVRVQLPMNFSKFDEPEPDISVVTGAVRDYADAHPKTAVLVVEVAETSLRLDRTTKAALYAEHLIEDYWIVNLKERCVEIYRRPEVNSGGSFSYAEKIVYGENESVAPLAKPKSKIKIADILP